MCKSEIIKSRLQPGTKARLTCKDGVATVTFRFGGIEYYAYSRAGVPWSYIEETSDEIHVAFPPMHPCYGRSYPEFPVLDALKALKQELLYKRTLCPSPKHFLTSQQYAKRIAVQ